MLDPGTAAIIALTCGVASLVLSIMVGIPMVRQWRQTQRTREAARALVEVHREQLDRRMGEFAARSEALAGHAAEVRMSADQLRADIAHLMWMADQIPGARDDLKQALLDSVLPTRPATNDERDAERAR